jgi:hypothetical protein
MVGGWYVSGLDAKYEEIGQQAAEQADRPVPDLDPVQHHWVTFFAFYWILAILLLLGMIYIALMDYWAVRRFGLRQTRQLQADRRAMLERQMALLRAERNGHQD